jgi:hypothetical protein
MSRPRIVENSDISYPYFIIIYAQNNTYICKKNQKCFYGHDFEDVVNANGEVGITGSRRKPHRKSPRAQIKAAP